jgi:hypothetical protein
MFYKLIFAHLLADFVLQTNWIMKHKRQWHGMTIHISLVLGTMMLMAWGVLSDWWLLILGIAASHALIDWAKLHLDRENQMPFLSFLADQAIHLTIIAAVVYAGAEFADKGLLLGHRQPVPILYFCGIYCSANLYKPNQFDAAQHL